MQGKISKCIKLFFTYEISLLCCLTKTEIQHRKYKYEVVSIVHIISHSLLLDLLFFLQFFLSNSNIYIIYTNIKNHISM